jgi:hypothetical protein
LMYVLRQHDMSFRNVASFAAVVFKGDSREYMLYLNDAYGVAADNYNPAPAIEKHVEERLISCGFLSRLES